MHQECRTFKVLIEATQIDILRITETKLNDKIGHDAIEIEGYMTFRRGRYRKNGGDCVIYDKEKQLDMTKIKFRVDSKCETEVIWADLKLYSLNIAIAVAYRPPDDGDFHHNF